MLIEKEGDQRKSDQGSSDPPSIRDRAKSTHSFSDSSLDLGNSYIETFGTKMEIRKKL
jgi:hypothetical protein